MKILTGSFLLVIVLAFTSCEKPNQEHLPHSQSGKYIKLDDGSAAVGGDLDGVFRFMIIHDQSGQPMVSVMGSGGAGYRWNGWISFPEHGQVGFEAKCDRTGKGGPIMIGSTNFDLGKGEVFYLPSGSNPKQILGSTAGRRDDPENVTRLAEILRRHRGEQNVAGQPPLSP